MTERIRHSVGDIVRCVRPHGLLGIGREYEVVSANSEYVGVRDCLTSVLAHRNGGSTRCPWLHERFEPVAAGEETNPNY